MLTASRLCLKPLLSLQVLEMLTLEKAKLFLRVDQDYEDELITALIASTVGYIETATGLDEESQAKEPLIDTLQSFLVMSWYARGYDSSVDKTIESLLKTIKARAALCNGE